MGITAEEIVKLFEKDVRARKRFAIKPKDRKYLWRIGPIITIVSILALIIALYIFHRPVTGYYRDR